MMQPMFPDGVWKVPTATILVTGFGGVAALLARAVADRAGVAGAAGAGAAEVPVAAGADVALAAAGVVAVRRSVTVPVELEPHADRLSAAVSASAICFAVRIVSRP